MFRQLIQRSGNPAIYKARDDALDALCSLTKLRQIVEPQDLKTIHCLSLAFTKLCRKERKLMDDLVNKIRLDPEAAKDGRSASLWALCLPKADVDETVWENVVKAFDKGLQAVKWHPMEFRVILNSVAYWGIYPPSFPSNVETYVSTRSKTASVSEVTSLMHILTQLPENRGSMVLHDVAVRAAIVAESLTPNTIGSICRMLLKIGFCHNDLLVSLQEQSIRFAEECDTSAAVQYFAFCLMHDAEYIDIDSLKCVIEKLLEGEEPLKLDQLLLMLKSLRNVPPELQTSIKSELKLLVQFIATEATELFTTSADNGGIPLQPLDAFQGLVAQYISLVRTYYRNKPLGIPEIKKQPGKNSDVVTKSPAEEAGEEDELEEGEVRDPATVNITNISSIGINGKLEGCDTIQQESDDDLYPPLPQEVSCSFDAICKFIEDNAETIVADDNPIVFSLIPNLFQAATDRSRKTALSLMKEMASQVITLPAVQSFRFLLNCGDYVLFERKTLSYLRRQFSISVKEIPMIQLCVALKCFVKGHLQIVAEVEEAGGLSSLTPEEEVDFEEDEEQMQEFLFFCDETISKALSTGGIDVKCSLSAMESIGMLKYKEGRSFFERMITYMGTKVNHASPEIHSIETAENCLKILADLFNGEKCLDESSTETYQLVRGFLETVVEKGEHDDLRDVPSSWMNRNDPANFITPLTEEQEKGWALLREMNETRSADTVTLGKLCDEYLAMIDVHRIDDLKYFFSMFAEKVYKNDKAIKTAMEHLLKSGTITKLAGSTISSMLVSLSQIRFIYFKTLKEFLLGVSEEQWSQMEAATIATLVQSFGKLSLRLPTIMLYLGERLATVYKLLTPLDIAVLLAGLQQVGYSDPVVLSMIMQHAANNAKRFDEVAMAVFWSAPHVHRLINQEETAVPLLTQTCQVTTSPQLQEKIISCVKKSALPRDVINSNVLRLAAANERETKVLKLEERVASGALLEAGR